jgi:hypothetical protein
MWGRFWDSFGAVDHVESSSQLSDTSSLPQTRLSSHLPTNAISPQPSSSLSQLKSYSDISPNESASMVNQSSSIVPGSTTVLGSSSESFNFKFTTAGQKTHRVVCKPLFNELLEAVRVKMLPEHGDDVGDEEWLTISYLDDEDDDVLISSDTDVADAVHLALKEGQTRVKLLVYDQKSDPKLAMVDPEEEEDIVVVKTVKAEEKPKVVKQRTVKASPTIPQQPKKNDLLLPAAIGFLGIVIVGVFVLTRVQQNANKH